MSSLKKFINFLIELWKNKRTRALFFFILYLIFIVIIVIFVRINADFSDLEENNNTNNTNNTTNTELNNNIDNIDKLSYPEKYNYVMEITIENNEKYKIEYDNINNKYNNYFYNQNTNVYDIIDVIPTYVRNIDLNYILYLVNSTEKEYVTNYKDGTIQNAYNLIMDNSPANLTVKYNKDKIINSMELKYVNNTYNIVFN